METLLIGSLGTMTIPCRHRGSGRNSKPTDWRTSKIKRNKTARASRKRNRKAA